MKIKYIDGKCFSLGIKAGAKRVCDNQDHLNEINSPRRINVFPIPDADTGTNMASTMRTVVDNIRHRRINILQLSPVLSAHAGSGATGIGIYPPVADVEWSE